MKTAKNKVLVLFLSLFLGKTVFSQSESIRIHELNTKNSSWTSVLSGNAVCPPVRTSYGFAVLTDAKMISACTGTGATLWEKKIPGRPEPFFTVFSSDFLLTVSDSSKLSLINPSGSTLWTKDVSFKITTNPVSGRDSRIFVKGKKNIACYGLNGILKWEKTTPLQADFPLAELNDGSILAILEKDSGGKSSAIRFSPFGKELETVHFTGTIQEVLSSSDGIFLSFISGGCGMCSVNEGKTVTKWTIPYGDKAFSNTTPASGMKFLYLSNHRGAVLANGSSFGGTRVIIFSTFDGRVSDFFNISVPFFEISSYAATSDSDDIFLCGKKQAFLYSSEGNAKWSANLPSGADLFSKWDFITFTKDNFLVICSKAWAMGAFRVSYKITSKKSVKQTKKLDYSEYYTIDTSVFDLSYLEHSINENIVFPERRKILSEGNYGEQEIDFASKLQSFCKAYNSHLMQSFSGARVETKSIFDRDAANVQELLFQLSLFGTDDFTKIIAGIIRMEKNKANLQAVLKSISQFGYDPDGQILKSIETKMRTLSVHNNTEFLLMCDAVYEICRFMGRPALYSKGMSILTELLYPQYESTVRDYARETLSKITALKI